MNYLKVKDIEGEEVYINFNAVEEIYYRGGTTVITMRSGIARVIKGDITKDILQFIRSCGGATAVFRTE